MHWSSCCDAWGHIAADVATGSRPEIGEFAEGSGGGSSTMPHKNNPVRSVLIRRAALTAGPLGATLHAASAASVDERSDGAWHAEWATLRTLARRTVVAAVHTSDLVSRTAGRRGPRGRQPRRRRRPALRTAHDGRIDRSRSSSRLHRCRRPADRRDAETARRRFVKEVVVTIPRLATVDFGGPADGPAAAARPVAGHVGRHAVGGGRRGADRARSASLAGTCPGTAAARPAAPFTHRRSGRRRAGAGRRARTPKPSTTQEIPSAAASACSSLLDAPHRVTSATLMCTGAVIGTPDGWHDRAATVRADGIEPMVAAAPQRWFAPRLHRAPARASAAALLDALSHTDAGVLCADVRGAGRLRRRRPTARDRHAGARHRRPRATYPLHRSRCSASHPECTDGRARRAGRRRTPRAGGGAGSGCRADRRARRAGAIGRPSRPPTRCTRRAWRCGARCSATPTSTAPWPPPPT